MSDTSDVQGETARPNSQPRPLWKRIVGRLQGYRRRIFDFYYREKLRIHLWFLRLKTGKPLLIFVRFGAIGDIICTFPALDSLRRIHSDYHCVYITLAEFGELPGLASFPGTVLTSPVHCSIPKLSNWGAPLIIEPRYTDETQGSDSSQHLVEEFFTASKVPYEPGSVTRFRLEPEFLASVAARFNLSQPHATPIVAIHTGPSWRVREWPHEHWQQLVSVLATQLRYRVIRIGARRHVGLGIQDLQQLEGAEDVVDHLSLTELAALLAQVDLFIGIDSGMLHLAGAVATPVVGIFGPTNPALRLPCNSRATGVFHQLPCSFCHHRKPRLHWESGCPYDAECMHHLTVDQVVRACESLVPTHHRSH